MTDLVTFAKGYKVVARTCSVCEHHLRAELEAAYEQGVRWAAMRAWLVEIHSDTSLSRSVLEKHFAREHHLG